MEWLASPNGGYVEPNICGLRGCPLDGCVVDVICGIDACVAHGCIIRVCPIYLLP